MDFYELRFITELYCKLEFLDKEIFDLAYSLEDNSDEGYVSNVLMSYMWPIAHQYSLLKKILSLFKEKIDEKYGSICKVEVHINDIKFIKNLCKDFDLLESDMSALTIIMASDDTPTSKATLKIYACICNQTKIINKNLYDFKNKIYEKYHELLKS